MMTTEKSSQTEWAPEAGRYSNPLSWDRAVCILRVAPSPAPHAVADRARRQLEDELRHQLAAKLEATAAWKRWATARDKLTAALEARGRMEAAARRDTDGFLGLLGAESAADENLERSLAAVVTADASVGYIDKALVQLREQTEQARAALEPEAKKIADQLFAQSGERWQARQRAILEEIAAARQTEFGELYGIDAARRLMDGLGWREALVKKTLPPLPDAPAEKL
jgi:hypothetical protein